ncbi:MAG: alpha/beta hydrolase [Legionellaceae bacterium]|nr:alpha/beta hydrolase [Legionellaceae bacterium]
MKNGFIDVENGRVFYQTQGAGERDVVWVHGLPLNSDCWYAQVNFFEPHFRNIALDLRGYGKSSVLPDNTNSVTELYVSDLLALFKTLKLNQPILVGFASGGHVALRFAAQHSDLIHQLILINASPCFMKQKDWDWGFTPETLADFISKIHRAELPGQVSELIFANALKDCTHTQREKLQTWFEGMLSKAKKETILAFFNNIAHDDDRNLLQDIVVPTLIISGILSDEVPPEVGLYLREHIRDSQLFELNHIDQFAFATQSSLVNHIIKQFIKPSCRICIPDETIGDNNGRVHHA